MHIVLLPIEPLEERYSRQWLDWTLEFFNSTGHFGHQVPKDLTYDVLLPESYESIQNGQFLDCIKTNAFKAKQLQMAVDWISKQDERVLRTPETVFFLHDGWFPGIEMLAYIRNSMGYSFRIAACLHAGTWDVHDFIYRTGMQPWASRLESAWFTIYDHVFVATDFHKELIIKSGVLGPLSCPISITGFPIFSPDDNGPLLRKYARYTEPRKPKKKRKDLVVFPNRLAPEKRPALFDALADRASKMPELSHLSFVKTMDECKGLTPRDAKRKYYDMLRSAKYAVSFSTQETWGIAMQESVMLGCIPIVPSRLSYKEMYPPCFRVPNAVTMDAEVEYILARLAILEGNLAYAESKREELTTIFKVIGSSALSYMLADLAVPNAIARSGSRYGYEVDLMHKPDSELDRFFQQML